jgi:hypothetical protein
MSKIVSQLDAEGYFVGYTTADESPLEPGVFLLPGGAIEVEAPEIPAGKRAKWLGDSWVLEDIPSDVAPEPEPREPGPITQVTRRQARLALLAAGKLDQLEAYIAAVEDPVEQKRLQIEYEADTWERSNPTLQAVWVTMGGTEAEFDALFTLAAGK